MNVQMIPSAGLSPALVARFVAIVGARYAVTDAAAKEPYLVEGRGLYHGTSPVVLRPGTVAEVAAIVRLAAETGTAIVPQGGNTGLVGGQIAHHGEVVVSLTRLDRIREVDAVSGTMTCEAGVVLADAQAAATAAGRLFPLSLGAEGSCTIGGNLSTNAGGTGAFAYGVTRDLVVGVEVVLPDGRVLNALNKLKKDNTGYDLKNLFIGAEGTLGIITAAVLKLFPAPNATETAFAAVPSPQAALELLTLVQERTNRAATSFELISRTALGFAIRHGHRARDPLEDVHPWYVLIETRSAVSQDGHHEDGHREDLRTVLEETLETGMERGLVSDAAVADSLEQRRAFWYLREILPEAQKPEGGSIKHDISVPLAAIPAFLREADAAAAAVVPGCRPVAFGHLGDGNIHYNVSQPEGADAAAYLARWDDMNAAVHAVVLRHGGSISAEHGIGVMKRRLLAEIKDPVAFDVMGVIKRALDPGNILNPGKVL